MWLVPIVVCIGWIFSLSLHEFGHAIVAYWGGDKSVKDKGYLTFNPLKYTDVNLSIILPLFFLLIGGIALPGGAVYINHSKLSNRVWESAVSAAGPVANLLAALLFSLPFWFAYSYPNDLDWFWSSLAFLIVLEIAVVFINLLPIPSLDGYGIIEPWLPQNLQREGHRVAKYGFLILFGLLWFAPEFNARLWELTRAFSGVLRIPPEEIARGSAIFWRDSKYLVLGAIGILWIFRSKERQWYQKGQNLEQRKQYDRAIAAYDRAIELKENFSDAWEAKAELLRNLQQYDRSLEAYDRLLRLEPDNGRAWACRSYILNELGRKEEALDACDKALECQTDYYPQYLKGVILENLERYEEAAICYRKACELPAPEIEKIWFLQGRLLERMGRNEESLLSYDRALQIAPSFQEARDCRNMLLQKLQKS